VHVLAQSPKNSGSDKIKVDAYSDNGLDLSQNFFFEIIYCLD